MWAGKIEGPGPNHVNLDDCAAEIHQRRPNPTEIPGQSRRYRVEDAAHQAEVRGLRRTENRTPMEGTKGDQET